MRGDAKQLQSSVQPKHVERMNALTYSVDLLGIGTICTPCFIGTPRAHLERSYSQPDQAFSYNTLSHMNPRTYRNHAWAQLAKSDTFYRRGSPEERELQRALGLDVDGDLDETEGGQDLEAQGAYNNMAAISCPSTRLLCAAPQQGCHAW